jgi:hypothetical protein
MRNADSNSDCKPNSDSNGKLHSFGYPKFNPAAYSNTEIDPGTAASSHASASPVARDGE